MNGGEALIGTCRRAVGITDVRRTVNVPATFLHLTDGLVKTIKKWGKMIG